MPTATVEPVEGWEALPVEGKRRFRDALQDRLVRPIRRWADIARPNQLPPAWAWFVWLILAGRGWGKTRTGAEWAADRARRYPGCRIALVAQTFQDGRDTMVEGESGLLAVLARHELRGGDVDGAWNRTNGELYLANGTRFKVFSSEKPARLRGPQHHFAWGDEPATWLDAHKGPSGNPTEGTTWSNLAFGCRLALEGTDGEESTPQIVLTGTPKPVKLLTENREDPKGLLHRESTAITRGHTDENLDNLASSYRAEVVEPVRGTRLGRQELAAEILEDVEGALWKRDWLDENRVEALPYPGEWQGAPRTGVDLSDGGPTGAKQAYVTAGRALDNDLYVHTAVQVRARPYEFACEVIRHSAALDSIIVLEKNHGGEWALEVFRRAMMDLGIDRPIQVMNAGRGKKTRAAPVAALYEPRELGNGQVVPGRVHHVGYHAELEEQQTTWTDSPSEPSPDLIDGLVWALDSFTGHTFRPDPSPEQDKAIPWNGNGQAAVPVDERAVAWR